MTILVSACLLGCPCRYDGAAKADSRVLALMERHTLIPVCPEQLGGLPTPRLPSERREGGVFERAERDERGAQAFEDGKAGFIIEGKCRVLSDSEAERVCQWLPLWGSCHPQG